MSLVQSGQLALELAPVDLAEVVLPTIAAMAPDLHAVGIVVETRLRPAPMIGDAARLRQALAAALTNAQRYAPDSGPLTIETGTSPQGIVLRVLDRGPGVSEEIAARAFERFWRGEHSRDRARGGSGLGLSVVRAIAEAHGGSASLTPRAGGGAAFEMLLAVVPPRLDTVSTIA
jgi:two-component system sensor histidine kinase AdeS